MPAAENRDKPEDDSLALTPALRDRLDGCGGQRHPCPAPSAGIIAKTRSMVSAASQVPTAK